MDTHRTNARLLSSCDNPREISFLRTRISTTKTQHATAMLKLVKMVTVLPSIAGYKNLGGTTAKTLMMCKARANASGAWVHVP